MNKVETQFFLYSFGDHFSPCLVNAIPDELASDDFVANVVGGCSSVDTVDVRVTATAGRGIGNNMCRK